MEAGRPEVAGHRPAAGDIAERNPVVDMQQAVDKHPSDMVLADTRMEAVVDCNNSS